MFCIISQQFPISLAAPVCFWNIHSNFSSKCVRKTSPGASCCLAVAVRLLLLDGLLSPLLYRLLLLPSPLRPPRRLRGRPARSADSSSGLCRLRRRSSPAGRLGRGHSVHRLHVTLEVALVAEDLLADGTRGLAPVHGHVVVVGRGGGELAATQRTLVLLPRQGRPAAATATCRRHGKF